MKTLYHTFNWEDSIFYEQDDLFEVGELKKTKKESWEDFKKTWTYDWRTAAISTPSTYSKAYDTVKDFMTRIKLLDSNAKFYRMNSASWSNDSNNVWWKLYAVYNREVIPEEVEEWTWRVVREALIEPTVYRLEDYPYDQWKFITLALFKDIIWMYHIDDYNWRLTKEMCDQCNSENLEWRKLQVETLWQKKVREREAQQTTIGNE